MTQKKLTIGVTAFVLATAGAFATKPSNKVKFTDGFTFNGTAASSPNSCTTNAANHLCRTRYPDGRILYTEVGKQFNPQIKTLRTTH